MVVPRLIAVFSTFLVGIHAHAIAQHAPAITPAPVIERQATNQGFVGYYSTPGLSWDTGECVGTRTFTTSASYGVCCNSVVCGRNDFATACSGVYAMYADGPYSCPTTCNTDFVLQTANDPNPTLWIGCDDDGAQTNFYETMPASITSVATTANTVSQSTITVPPGGQSSVPTFSPTPTPKKKNSLVWIAGVAVGVVVIAVIAGIVIFFCLRSKKRRTAQTNPPMAPMQQQPQQYMQPPPGSEQRYSTPAPQYTNTPYQQPQSPPPGQQWATVPSSNPTPVSPITSTFPPPEKSGVVHQEQQFLDAKPQSPVTTVSEIASPQTYGTQPHSGTVSEIGSPQPRPAQPVTPSSFETAQAGPVSTHLPPNHASELQ